MADIHPYPTPLPYPAPLRFIILPAARVRGRDPGIGDRGGV